MKPDFMARAVVLASLTTASGAGWALEIDPNVLPEISFGGVAIPTVDARSQRLWPGGTSSEKQINVSDSALLLGFSKYLFAQNNYGYAAFGLRLPDDDTDFKDDMFVHQFHAGVGGKNYDVKLGRTRLPNTLIIFPTVRDEDLLDFTYVQNGQSNARTELYHIFGNVAQATYWLTPYLSVAAAAVGWTETDPADLATNPRKSTAELNGAALTLAYDQPEAIKFDRGLRYAGVSVNYQNLDALGTSPGDRKTAVIGALTYNFSNDPQRTLVLDLQGIWDGGAQVNALTDPYQRARAKSRAVAAALRYGHRPALQTRWQAALTAAWKEYDEFGGASAFAIAPSLAYRLGSGVDLVAQYLYRDNDSALAAATGVNRDQRILLGLKFSFDFTLNESVGERGSILNLERNMTNYGPVSPGH